jgi:hypothetical protein
MAASSFTSEPGGFEICPRGVHIASSQPATPSQTCRSGINARTALVGHRDSISIAAARRSRRSVFSVVAPAEIPLRKVAITVYNEADKRVPSNEAGDSRTVRVHFAEFA